MSHRLVRRWNRAHVVLAAGFVMLFFSAGMRFAFGLALAPMTEDLSLSRSGLSSALTMFMLVSAFAMPVVGRLIDRYSIRMVMATGALIGSAGLGLMGGVNAAWQVFALYGGLYAIGFAATSVAPVSVLMSRWFPNSAGLASSVALTGNGTGQLVIIALLSSSLKTIGWRSMYAILGAVSLIAVPVALLAVRSRPPSGDTASGEAGRSERQERSIRPVLSSMDFWMLIGLYSVCGAQDFFVATHVVAFAQDQGVSQAFAGNMLAFMGVAAMAGVLAAGAMADRMGAKVPTLLCFALRVGLFGFIPFFQSAAAIAAFALLYGFSFTITAPLTVVFARNVFGASKLGAVSGLINMAHQIAGGAGALAGAMIFDATGSYDGAFFLMLGLTAVAAAATFAVRERRRDGGLALTSDGKRAIS